MEFGLYCENGWKKGLLGTSLMLSDILSVMIYGILANEKGRKFSLLLSFSILSVSLFLLGFA